MIMSISPLSLEFVSTSRRRDGLANVHGYFPSPASIASVSRTESPVSQQAQFHLTLSQFFEHWHLDVFSHPCLAALISLTKLVLFLRTLFTLSSADNWSSYHAPCNLCAITYSPFVYHLGDQCVENIGPKHLNRVHHHEEPSEPFSS